MEVLECNVGSGRGVRMRAARACDRAARAALVRDSLVEYDLSAFLLFFFQEATLEAAVLGGAVLFIFCGVGLWASAAVLPALATCVALGVTLAHRAAAQRHAGLLLHELCGVVATCGPRVVATASLAECRGERGAAWLQHVAVAAPWRRQGVASALLVQCEAAARGKGRYRLHALLSDLHVAPRALLLHMHWRVVCCGARPVFSALELPLTRLCRDLLEHSAATQREHDTGPDTSRQYSSIHFLNS